MSALSNTSIKQPRKSLIASIQCESKKLKQLEAENLELKSTLQDYELVMKLMNQKYRNHISKLISHMNMETKLNVNNVINLKYIQKIDEQSQKIDHLMNFIQKILNLDVQNFLDIQKSLTKLELENEGLRQMLGIAKENNNFKPSTISCVIATQTDNLENDLNNDSSEISLIENSKDDLKDAANDSHSNNVELNNDKKLNNSIDSKEERIKLNKVNSATIKKVIKEDLKKA